MKMDEKAILTKAQQELDEEIFRARVDAKKQELRERQGSLLTLFKKLLTTHKLTVKMERRKTP